MTAHHHDNTRMTIDMPFEEHKKLKAMAAFMGVSLKELVLNCLRDHLLSYNEPNAETKTLDVHHALISHGMWELILG